MNFLELIANAIAMQEGFFAEGENRSKKNNNLGNMRASCLQRLKDDKGFVKFTSPQEGYAALIVQLGLFVARGYSLRQVISAWAPPSDGNATEAYLRFVAKRTGISPDQRLMDLYTIQKV